MTLPRLAVFDMAGTSVDDSGGAVNACFRAALAAVDCLVDPVEVDAVMGLPKPEAIRLLLQRSGTQAPLLDRADAIHDDFLRRMIAHYAKDPSVREIPGTTEVFRALQSQGIRVALDTGFSRPIARVILDRLGWERDGLIDGSITSDEVARGRPHPDMIHALMERLGVSNPTQVLKAGDAPADVEEGRNVGCGWIVAVTSGAHDARTLANHRPTHIVASIAEIPALLGIMPTPPTVSGP